MRPRLATTIASLVVAACASACGDPRAPVPGVVRIGHFPNLTHAHGVLGHAATRSGQGWFERRLPAGTRVEWVVFSAGSTAMLSLVAGGIDLCYVGPSPALNLHLRSGGEEVRVLAAAARGGSALVVRGDGSVRKAADLRRRRLATPELGNTQDVAARAWLASHGLGTTEAGGDVTVLPSSNPTQLALFVADRVDAAWTVEPWVARLELDGGGRVLVEEPEALTTLLVARSRFLSERRADARAFLAAHVEMTEWIEAHPDEAKARFQAELRAETGGALRAEVLDRAWSRIRWTAALSQGEFETFAASARALGLLPAGALASLVEAP
jgi:NitT/TauT family transport system substrate-binding protein